MQKIQCPTCKQDGVLQWKETVTKAKGRMYHYRKLYVYHQHPKEHPERPKWCYLTTKHIEALGITQNTSPITQKLTQNNSKPNNLKSSLDSQNSDAIEGASIAQSVEQQPCKLQVAGSIPARGSMHACGLFSISQHLVQIVRGFRS